MNDKPPQDDDPNFSSLNPMGAILLFPNSCRQGVSFAQRLGVGKMNPRFLLTFSLFQPETSRGKRT
jgi:hypothetical protein